MAHKILSICYMLSPLLGGAIVQGLFIRYDWCKSLKKPIDFRMTLRGRRLLGNNKTFRGFFAFSIGTTFVLVLQTKILHDIIFIQTIEILNYGTIHSWLLGILMGLGAMLSELPNSFVKRQLNVSPGKRARGVWFICFYVIDQIDILMGTWLMLSMITVISMERILISFLIVFIIHQIINIIGYFLGMRKTLY